MSDESSERRLFERHRDGDPQARDQLIERYLPLAHRLAARYRHSGEPLDDLKQVASVGLINSIDRYDPDTGPFMRYAMPNILGELKRHFRDRTWGLHVPRSLQERVLRVNTATDTLFGELERSPTPRDVAHATGLQLEEVLEAMDVASAYTPAPLDAPAGMGDEADRSVAETIGEEDARFELVEMGHSVAPAFRLLPPRERQILRMRFMEDLTQAEIAERVGMSQMHVSRLLRRSLNVLSEAVGDSA